MTIHEQLTAELHDAMKKSDRPRRDVVRQVETEVSVARSAPGFSGPVDDSLYRKVIASYVKKMEKAREEYVGLGERGRPMAEKLAFEIEFLSRWLPAKLDSERTRRLVKEAIAELGVSGPKGAGRVVGHLMKAHGEELDGALVNRIAREELEA